MVKIVGDRSGNLRLASSDDENIGNESASDDGNDTHAGERTSDSGLNKNTKHTVEDLQFSSSGFSVTETDSESDNSDFSENEDIAVSKVSNDIDCREDFKLLETNLEPPRTKPSTL